MRISDWSSDVCSSDLLALPLVNRLNAGPHDLGNEGGIVEGERRDEGGELGHDLDAAAIVEALEGGHVPADHRCRAYEQGEDQAGDRRGGSGRQQFLPAAGPAGRREAGDRAGGRRGGEEWVG